ncbi:MAG: hypothetical protein HYX47_00075 [Burkholderiales bacterium]|nr:hypothetical protein [Burkholderiales bacterium]
MNSNLVLDPTGTNVAPRVRCGSLLEGRTREIYLALHVQEAELEEFALPPAAAGLTLMHSPAEVMYAVVRLQRGTRQWRFLVPIWSETALAWLRGVVASQCIPLAASVPGSEEVAISRCRLGSLQPHWLSPLEQEWPELADADKLTDVAVALTSVAAPEDLGSLLPSCGVEAVELVANCSWLQEYLLTADPSAEELAKDLEIYCELVG